MRRRYGLPVVAAVTLVACTVTQPAGTPQTDARAAAIAELSAQDPDSPEVLTARLDYVESLIESAPDHCGDRLGIAQSELKRVRESPATRVMFPEGWGRVDDDEYRIHRQRATCSTDPDVRREELQSALAEAQGAVQLYREAFDYKSMVTMQFNSAVLQRMLGQDAAAVAALESTIEMDREYGFRDDAQDNYAALLRLQNRPADPESVRVLMSDFPHRSVNLKFAWSTSDATLATASNRVLLTSGKVFHSESTLTARRHVRQSGEGWVVSIEPDPAGYDPGVWASEPSELPESVFSPALLQWPSFEIHGDGSFKGVVDVAGFSARLSSATEALIRDRAAASDLARRAVRATKGAFAPQVVDAEVTQNYALQTGMWVGATLEQGVWYELSAPLSLPGVPRVLVTHRLEFAYTHEVPCASESMDRSCVEIVIRASPQEEALAAALTSFPVPPEELHYAAATYVRLIVDPETLLLHVRETRRYWYLVVGASSGDALLESERLVSSVRYH